jgi:hypothetical protein
MRRSGGEHFLKPTVGMIIAFYDQKFGHQSNIDPSEKVGGDTYHLSSLNESCGTQKFYPHVNRDREVQRLGKERL